MAITRAKATALLNKTEMGLFDDSRSNAVRGHSEARLNQLVTRARTARDRARDLEKRQRLASRGATGSKTGRSGQANARTGEKVELLSDILARFEARQSQTAKTAKTTKTTKSASTTKAASPATKKAAQADRVPAKSVGKKVATKTTATKKVAATKPSGTKSSVAGRDDKTATTKAVKKAASAAAAGKGENADKASSGRSARSAKSVAAASSAKPAKRASTGDSSGITPEKALKNTRKLLKTREQEAKSAKSWETIGADGATETTPGFQSPQAKSKSLDLHAAEIRQTPIQGSISTRDRKSQGKRDNRNSNDS